MFDTVYIWYSVSHLFFEKPGNRNRSQGRMRPSDPFASSFPGFSFSSSFGFGNGFGSDPFGSNRYRKCFPDFWHHCNFTSRKYSGQKRINPMSNFAPSVEHCIVLNLNFWGGFLSLTPILDISTALMRPRRPKQYCLQLNLNFYLKVWHF